MGWWSGYSWMSSRWKVAGLIPSTVTCQSVTGRDGESWVPPLPRRSWCRSKDLLWPLQGPRLHYYFNGTQLSWLLRFPRVTQNNYLDFKDFNQPKAHMSEHTILQTSSRSRSSRFQAHNILSEPLFIKVVGYKAQSYKVG